MCPSGLAAERKAVVYSICAMFSIERASPWHYLVVQQGRICASDEPGGSLITDFPLEVKGITVNRPRRVWRQKVKKNYSFFKLCYHFFDGLIITLLTLFASVLPSSSPLLLQADYLIAKGNLMQSLLRVKLIHVMYCMYGRTEIWEHLCTN